MWYINPVTGKFAVHPICLEVYLSKVENIRGSLEFQQEPQHLLAQ
ncbi:hypothetical protein TcasGA2_TC032526 [Tribolium castaneum]|uniref:Uncharacterized protein n=1 Tax=Tribolium castaneum TaxID=7070 RepID=A0A139WL39_TRICA|nr:hypothetical protein TcasGA2_TC032526 [Tribolium castaneum]